MRLLIVEDDPVLADGLTRAMRGAGYTVDLVTTGTAADTALATQTFDILVLDLGLPGLPGLEVLKRARAREIQTSVLILTAMDSIEDRVRGLDLGADDYLTKPFNLTEFEARVRALARRSPTGGLPVISHGALVFDRATRRATLNGVTLDLSARELRLLEIFLQRSGRPVSKDTIVTHLCEWGEEVSDNAVEVYVHRLRKKLEPGGVRISTLRGLGYCLEAPAQPA